MRRKSASKRSRFTLDEFRDGMAGRQFSKDNLAIARAVLVDGRAAIDVATEYGVTRQWVTNVVSRARAVLLAEVATPTGWVTGEVTLPPEDWARVRAIEKAARRRLKSTKS